MFETSELKDTKVTCTHCGDICADEHIKAHHKDFCCNGCVTVYELLHEAGLDAYYDAETIPGISFRKQQPDEHYAYLDHLEIQQKLLDFNSPDFAKIHFFIPVIHCSSCVWLLENLYRLNNGVNQVQVNFGKREASISFNPSKISLRQLVELLRSIGYTPQIQLGKGANKKQKSVNRIGLKIGVAGFSFGNIMLLSFPEYLGIDELNESILLFIGYLNILLALPVLLYCSSDYFTSAWKGIKQKFINIDIPIAIGILTLFFRSTYEILSNTGAGYMDSLAGLLFFLLIGKWFQSKTYEGLAFDRDYTAYFPLAATRINNGEENHVLVDQIKVGDEILIRNNEIVPADAILLSENASIDYSFVTGEAAPVWCNKGTYIYAGGRQCGAAIRLAVEKESNRSYLTGLWNNEAFAKSNDLVKHRAIDKISKHFTIIILSIAFSAALFWTLVEPANAWQAFTAVLIVACPCALAMSTPFSNGNVMRVLGRNKFYLKHADVSEKIAEVDTIVFDKTGTITASSESKINYFGKVLTDEELSMLKTIVKASLHPLSKRIADTIPLPKFEEEVTYISEEAGLGIRAVIAGRNFLIGSAIFVLNNQEDAKAHASYVHVAIDNEYKGYYEIKNVIRAGLADLIKKLSNHNSLHVLSGDNDADKDLLERVFPKGTTMLFKQGPDDKLNYIKSLKSKGHRVMMLGDGLNDAAALKISDVGIAVADDTSHFSPACDGIIQADALHKLDDFIHMSKFGRRVLYSSFGLSFLYNVVGLSFAVAALLTPIFAAVLMPLSSISVVSFTTLSIALKSKQKLL
jgi:P-type Cu+ transporter